MANSNEYMREYMIRRYHKRRAFAIEKLGGKCKKCGTTDSLEIDHVNRGEKQIDFGKVWSYAWTTFIEELMFCQLLCQSCHREKTSAEQSVPHGGGLTGKKSCRCDLCRPLKNAYARELKRLNKLALDVSRA